MTPEERAGAILRDYRHAAGRMIPQPIFLGRSIAAAIRAAVEVERAACAEIADHTAMRLSDHTYGSIASESIAAAIRAREDTA